MSVMLQIGKSGAKAYQNKVNVGADNIANSTTIGFKKGQVSFQDLIYIQDKSPRMNGNNPATYYQGKGVQAQTVLGDFSQGSLLSTSKTDDYAIEGNGFFGVLDANTGELLLTRDGTFGRNPMGELVDAQGNRVMTQTMIAENGTTLVQPLLYLPNQTANLTQVGQNNYAVAIEDVRTNLTNPNDFGTVQSGFLENSNVDMSEEMTNLIIAQRAYSMNLKSIQTADETLQVINQLR